jgi:hypothetical protein
MIGGCAPSAFQSREYRQAQALLNLIDVSLT